MKSEKDTIHELARMLDIIVCNAILIPDPAMDGHTDTYSVPVNDIEEAKGLVCSVLGLVKEKTE